MAATSEVSATGLLNLEQELVCFICTEVLYQPLTLIDCLHTFCGSCLKEWFSHQHRKATHSRNNTTSNPYTCPTCRATVKDARYMAKIATLLDMFLAAHPGRDRSVEEKVEMSGRYKRGDDILPPVDTSRRRERRRREDDELAAREQRMVEEARERSLRDVAGGSSRTADRLAPRTATHQTSRSRDREERREQRRERERRERERHEELGSGEGSRSSTSQRRADVVDSGYQSPPPTSPRHPDAVEARRSRTVAHQSSLRSLVSSSESGTGTGDSLSEARLMQEIQAEGLLDGINVDALTEAEQDELIEIIAERYRQLHPERVPRSTSEDTPSEREQSNDVAAGLQNLQLEEADRPRQGTSRNRQRRPDGTIRTTTTASTGSTDNRPTITPSQTGENANNLNPPSADRAHRRRTSDQSGRQEARSSNRTTRPDTTCTPATRSATDLSDNPQTQTAASEDRVRQLSATQRAHTEPRHSPRASESWHQGGVHKHLAQDSSPSEAQTTTNTSPPSQMRHSTSGGQALAAPAELESQNASSVGATVPARFTEPSVSCARCSRPEIQYEVHKHCSPCNLDICLRCYRRGRGCDHWFGFGHAALTKFEASQPQSRVSQAMELPHTPVSRQYSKPPLDLILRDASNNSSRAPPVTTTSDPSSRLQEGHFCDRCLAFSNACYWTCDYCNDGEWGFCNDCINSHHCCTHPLRPIAHKLFAPGLRQSGYDPHTGTLALTPLDLHASIVRPSPGHSHPSSAASTPDPSIGPHPEYIQLTITTNCDVCMQPISPADARYHCPAHPSPSHQQPQGIGDYDICTSCYHNQVKAGRIRREDGPAGWRKCPHGHRMIVTAFEADREGSLRRLVLRDLVGGNKVTDEDIAAWRSTMSPAAQSSSAMDQSQSPPMSSRGQWIWREDSTGTRRSTRNRSSTLTPGGSGKFPPDGGFGKRCAALWTYHPEDGEEGRGELMFPKNAEVKEIEEINEEWSHGVYAGDAGVLPAAYVRDLQRG